MCEVRFGRRSVTASSVGLRTVAVLKSTRLEHWTAEHVSNWCKSLSDSDSQLFHLRQCVRRFNGRQLYKLNTALKIAETFNVSTDQSERLLNYIQQLCAKNEAVNGSYLPTGNERKQLIAEAISDLCQGVEDIVGIVMQYWVEVEWRIVRLPEVDAYYFKEAVIGLANTVQNALIESLDQSEFSDLRLQYAGKWTMGASTGALSAVFGWTLGRCIFERHQCSPFHRVLTDAQFAFFIKYSQDREHLSIEDTVHLPETALPQIARVRVLEFPETGAPWALVRGTRPAIKDRIAPKFFAKM